MQRRNYERNYELSRKNLLLIMGFTLINIVMILSLDSYFLFSLTLPNFILVVINEEVQNGMMTWDAVNYPLLVTIMLIPILLLLVTYFLTKRNNYLWFILAIAVAIVDSVLAILVANVVDVIFHVYILVLLVMGIVNGSKLKKQLLIEKAIAQNNIDDNQVDFENETSTDNLKESTPLRIDEGKGRVLISVNYNSHNIVVKRKKALTELIVDGKVYAEKKGIFETYYVLSVIVDQIEIAFENANSRVLIYVNGKVIDSKIRWR